MLLNLAAPGDACQVLSLSKVSRARQGESSGSFFLFYENWEGEVLTLNTSLLQRVHENHGKLPPLQETIKTSSPSPESRSEHSKAQAGRFSGSQGSCWRSWEDHLVSQPFPVSVSPQPGPFGAERGLAHAHSGFLPFFPSSLPPCFPSSFLLSFYLGEMVGGRGVDSSRGENLKEGKLDVFSSLNCP